MDVTLLLRVPCRSRQPSPTGQRFNPAQGPTTAWAGTAHAGAAARFDFRLPQASTTRSHARTARAVRLICRGLTVPPMHLRS